LLRIVANPTPKTQRAPLNEAGDRIVQAAEFYTVQYFDENGRRKKAPTRCADKDAAQQVANDLEAKVALRRQGIVDPAQEKFAREGRRPIEEHVADFHTELVARENTAKHVDMTVARVKYVIAKAGAAKVSDLTPSTVQQVIKGIHDAGRSLETVNSYLRAIKSFSRWLWRDKRTADDRLVTLEGFNTATEEQRHARREVTPEELAHLLTFVERHTLAAHKLSGPDRAMLYRIALGTGYRVNELRSLTPCSFSLDGDPPTITVEAACSKRRRRDEQPIRRDLADLLGPWLAERPEGERVFRSMPRCMARTLRSDLDAARAAWIAGAQSVAEKSAREESQFLRYEDEDGRYADFHALRHTYISGIVASGASVKTAQTLARHSTSELTVGRYSHPRLLDLHGAVESLPGLPPSPPQQRKRATGTEGQGGEYSWGQMRGQLGGSTRQNVAKDGTRHGDCSASATGDNSESQPIMLSVLGNEKATSGATWREAEGTGVEPATPYGAPHFQCLKDSKTRFKHVCKHSRAKSHQMLISLGYSSLKRTLGTASRPMATK
jgi:integrase